jgi:UDP-N-acetyl-D-mannosaminuronic acid transferase (WecB/TagA/CpsF family)
MERYTRTGQASVSFVYFAQAMHHRCYEQTTDETNLSYQSALQSASILCIDGIAMQIFDYMGQLLIHHRRPVCSTNINGTQFTPYILSRLTQDYSVRLIVTSVYDDAKGKPRAYLDHAISVLQTEIPGLHCLYTYQCSFYERPGTFDIDECGQAITHDKLLAHPKPPLYILLNTIGSPYQEIRTHKHQDFLANHSIIAMNV